MRPNATLSTSAAALLLENARLREALRHAEAGVSDLAGRLIHAQEDERRRIGRELHDHVGQRLALFAIALDQLRSGSGDAHDRKLRELCAQADDLACAVHRVSHRLHSSMLDHLGLLPALQRLIADYAQGYDLAVDLTHPSELPPLSPDVSLCLFRIAEESLTNIAKHSGTHAARMTIARTPEGIRLTVQDRGVGFSPESVDHTAGLGLVSMRERLRLVGGVLRVQSAPARGTTIDVRVPLQHDLPSEAVVPVGRAVSF